MTRIKAIRIDRNGGPETMSLKEVDLGAPKPGEVTVRAKAIGVNFIDTYHRSGLYPVGLPSGLGMEAAGVVEAVGEGVTQFAKGDRVAYASGPVGAYAEAHNVAAASAAKIPDGVSDEEAASMMLKGLTAQFLLRQTFKVEKGQTILWHAAAGGVGLIACQWAKHLGATVIGTTSSDEKAAIARANGCDHVIDYTKEDVAERVKEITGGKKVPVVYDGVGKATFIGSLDSLAPLGLLVSFGNASGPVTDVNLGILAQKGSLYVTRPTMFHYAAKSSTAFQEMADDLFAVVKSGAVKIGVNQRYSLAEAARAHLDLEGRKTTGASVLIP
ncbi:Alcohol dehydrogenase zinc-binding domain protein [Parvibaculum lavamentivorans DS-1]|uniref:Alcohol dehydrogenase zinc-binding domain protein n=1 Tax=Parvibaculum lavamentivorans (strain DS-1 / DSM 13023 / NCIMB 13966) TaxID=402881 RepID=A7HSK1_PARL1|nr:quinone oxidoreductase [Parvibaculum lavamentivorans]ABS62884.1 Alcohol dehydrogenase zinc-binding domain protein [Parvibaculum lavamentivorans DS-1]